MVEDSSQKFEDHSTPQHYPTHDAYAVAHPVQVFAGGLPYGTTYQGLAGVPAGYDAAPIAAYASAPIAAAPATPTVLAAYAASLPASAQIPIPQPARRNYTQAILSQVTKQTYK